MAKIINGKRSGQYVELHQWCNDWVMTTEGKIYKITNLTFTREEIDRMLQTDCGFLWDEFELCKNMRFKRIRR